MQTGQRQVGGQKSTWCVSGQPGLQSDNSPKSYYQEPSKVEDLLVVEIWLTS